MTDTIQSLRDEIARLTEERDAAIRAALEPDPDALAALTAAAYETAANEWLNVRVEGGATMVAVMEYSDRISVLTPADALAAQAARDRRMRAEGMHEAAQMAEDWFYDPENDVVKDPRLAAEIRSLADQTERGKDA